VLREALWAEIEWFEQNLPVPIALWVKSRRRWRADGICWFQADAREMIARAFGSRRSSASAACRPARSRPAAGHGRLPRPVDPLL
jgi:hypothetical protein